jgi:hypothetical protein
MFNIPLVLNSKFKAAFLQMSLTIFFKKIKLEENILRFEEK